MTPNQETLSLLDQTGLKTQHFADLIRVAQLVFDPSGGLSGRSVEVDWDSFDMPAEIVENLRQLGQKYQFDSPYIPPVTVWEQLTPATRAWLIENKHDLGMLEEAFPARDED